MKMPTIKHEFKLCLAWPTMYVKLHTWIGPHVCRFGQNSLWQLSFQLTDWLFHYILYAFVYYVCEVSLVCTRFSPSHVDWLKQRKQRLIVTGSWRNSWDGTCHFDCTSSQCAAVRTLRSGPVCACVCWAFKLHTFCSEHGICHISLVIAEFSMFWDYIHAPGTKHGHRVFPGAPTASPPIGTFGKMSDADNWPLSWLQTSLLTMWENVTSHFSLSHQNILHQNQEDFNTHSSNKHGDRISRDGLSVWGGCVWLSLFGWHLSNQDSLSFTLSSTSPGHLQLSTTSTQQRTCRVASLTHRPEA